MRWALGAHSSQQPCFARLHRRSNAARRKLSDSAGPPTRPRATSKLMQPLLSMAKPQPQQRTYVATNTAVSMGRGAAGAEQPTMAELVSTRAPCRRRGHAARHSSIVRPPASILGRTRRPEAWCAAHCSGHVRSLLCWGHPWSDNETECTPLTCCAHCHEHTVAAGRIKGAMPRAKTGRPWVVLCLLLGEGDKQSGRWSDAPAIAPACTERQAQPTLSNSADGIQLHRGLMWAPW